MVEVEVASAWRPELEESLEDYRDRDGPGSAVHHLVSGVFAVSFGQATPIALGWLAGLTASVLRDVREDRLTTPQAAERLCAAMAAARFMERSQRRASA